MSESPSATGSVTDLRFIAFEGGEGAGKSTQAAMLCEALQGQGHEVVLTREPGGTPVGEAIRSVLLTPSSAGMDARAEALLFAAARAEHAERVIRPAVARGAFVLTDRYIDSSVAYQGVARSLGSDAVEEISLWATRGLIPDLTIVLDVDPGVGLGRAQEANRMEEEPREFHEQVRVAFLALARRDPDRYLVLDASRPREELARAVLARLAGVR